MVVDNQTDPYGGDIYPLPPWPKEGAGGIDPGQSGGGSG